MIASIERGQLRIQRRLAAADRHGRRAALVDGVQALRQRQPIGQLAGVPLDGAADARQVAGVQRLQHQHERVALPAAKRLSELVTNHVGGDVQRKTHSTLDSQTCLSVKRKQAGHCPEVSPMHDTIDAEPTTSGGALAIPIPGPTRLEHAIEAARDWLLARQHADGFWCGELDGDTTLESYPILLEAFLGRRDSEKSARLARTIRRPGAAGRRLEPVSGRARRSVGLVPQLLRAEGGGRRRRRAAHARRARGDPRGGRRGSGQHLHALPPGDVRAVPLARRCRRSRPR